MLDTIRSLLYHPFIILVSIIIIMILCGCIGYWMLKKVIQYQFYWCPQESWQHIRARVIHFVFLFGTLGTMVCASWEVSTDKAILDYFGCEKDIQTETETCDNLQWLLLANALLVFGMIFRFFAYHTVFYYRGWWLMHLRMGTEDEMIVQWKEQVKEKKREVAQCIKIQKRELEAARQMMQAEEDERRRDDARYFQLEQ